MGANGKVALDVGAQCTPQTAATAPACPATAS